MANLKFIQSQRRGVQIGSAWKNTKGGFGIRLRGKMRDAKGELIDITGASLVFQVGADTSILELGSYDQKGSWRKDKISLLMVPNSRKREGVKDPDFNILAYPNPEQK